MKKQHKIIDVIPGSPAALAGIRAGDLLLQLNHRDIDDVFDYHYLMEDTEITVCVRSGDVEKIFRIEKGEDEDAGLIFENGFMDEYRSCSNRCIFCFIDQMPAGMRDTLYFKDDDSRLSFLQGNYVTLTNMTEHDLDRIIAYRLSPINISFQTTNPELRCRMLNHKFAGEALKKVDRLYDGGIRMNGQIVLCKGINDGAELARSISDLTKYLPLLESVSVVPVGLTKFRDGLYPLVPFTAEDARAVIALIEEWQEKIYASHQTHFVHASDEFYLLAGMELPEEERYDGYLQLENGVGMLRLFQNETEAALRQLRKKPFAFRKHHVSIATGRLAYPMLLELSNALMRKLPRLTVSVYPIRNDFFGEMITVSGLLTGRDLIDQLCGEDLGEKLFLPQNLLRSGTDTLLDDLTVTDLADALQVKIDIVKSSGWDFVSKIGGDYINE